MEADVFLLTKGRIYLPESSFGTIHGGQWRGVLPHSKSASTWKSFNLEPTASGK